MAPWIIEICCWRIVYSWLGFGICGRFWRSQPGLQITRSRPYNCTGYFSLFTHGGGHHNNWRGRLLKFLASYQKCAKEAATLVKAKRRAVNICNALTASLPARSTSGKRTSIMPCCSVLFRLPHHRQPSFSGGPNRGLLLDCAQ